jgi:hypothetical protein
MACTEGEEGGSILTKYSVFGKVVEEDGVGVPNVKVKLSSGSETFTDNNGRFSLSNVSGLLTLSVIQDNAIFSPSSIAIRPNMDSLVFTKQRIGTSATKATELYTWLQSQQMSNGLVRSSDLSTLVSLYDNALAALVFTAAKDYTKAEKIFDHFNGRISTELTAGNGGFSQFRNLNGQPTGNAWLGDNAWLLIALNAYELEKPNHPYGRLKTELINWIRRLQQTNGAVYSGYEPNGNLLGFVVTEGMLDAFHAVPGYDNFHRDCLRYFGNSRFDVASQNIICDPSSARHRYALDNFSWAYSMIPSFPASILDRAEMFYTTKTATANNATVSGYCFDTDLDAVWPEGTMQMALAYQIAGNNAKADLLLSEMEKFVVSSSVNRNLLGIPYATNRTTHYGSSPLWQFSDTEPAVSSAAFYLFTAYRYNPYAVGRTKIIPQTDKFWN